MANLFGDIGRSNIAAVGQDLLDRAVDVRRQEADFATQNLGTAIDIERFKQEREANQIALEKGRAELEQNRKQQEFLNYKIPLRSIQHQFSRGGMPQEAIDTLVEEARQNNMIGSGKNGEYITRQDTLFMQQRFQEDLGLQEKLFASTVQGLEREAQQLESALNDPEKPLKGKEAEAAQKRLDVLMAPEGPLAMGYNFLENKLPEMQAAKEVEKVVENEKLFTPTAAQAQKFGLEPDKQYMGFFDKQGNIRTILRPATAEDLGTGGGSGTDPLKVKRDFMKEGEDTILSGLGANDFESLRPEAKPKYFALVHRLEAFGEQEEYGRPGTATATDVAAEFDGVPARIKKIKEEWGKDTEQGKKLAAQYPSPELLDKALRDKIKAVWGTTTAWGRDIPEWRDKPEPKEKDRGIPFVPGI